MRLFLVLVLLVTVSPAQQRDPDRLLSDAIQAQQRGDYQSAITGYRQLLRLRPDNVEAKVNLGASLAHVGQFVSFFPGRIWSTAQSGPGLLQKG